MNPEIIIVNYRSADVLQRCLTALAGQTREHSVQIVDNASGDGSVRTIHEQFPQHAMLPFRRNVGFGRAVNIAAARSQADIIVTLNPDTVPDPDFVHQICAPLEADPALGSVAGTLRFESRPDVIASAGINVHSNGVAIDARLGTRNDPSAGMTPVFGPSAGAAAYRRAAFLESGGLAEPFFMYLEDVDLAWRLRLQGYECIWNPAAGVLHRYSSSAGEGSAFKRRLLARNRLWTLVRCLPAQLWKRDGWRILAYDSAAFGFGVATLDKAVVSGRVQALAGLLPRLAERERIQQAMSIDMDTLNAWIKPPISPLQLRRLRRLTGSLAHVQE